MSKFKIDYADWDEIEGLKFRRIASNALRAQDIDGLNYAFGDGNTYITVDVRGGSSDGDVYKIQGRLSEKAIERAWLDESIVNVKSRLQELAGIRIPDGEI